jgi:hypothetical protein
LSAGSATRWRPDSPKPADFERAGAQGGQVLTRYYPGTICRRRR